LRFAAPELPGRVRKLDDHLVTALIRRSETYDLTLNFILGPRILKDKGLPRLHRSGQDHERAVVADRGCISLLFEHLLFGSLSPDNEPNFLAGTRAAPAFSTQFKKRMGSERHWKFFLVSTDLRRLIEILIAAFIAPD
jgi:hypothetical protein